MNSRRRIGSLTIVAIISLLVGALVWGGARTPDEDTLAWNAVTTYTDADGITQTIPATDRVYYEIFLVHRSLTSEQRIDEANLTLMGETELTQFTIPFTAEGNWVAGVRSVREVRDDAGAVIETTRSTISWSDDSTVTASGEAIWWAFFFRPDQVIGLR